jgi:hypothetical protein
LFEINSRISENWNYSFQVCATDTSFNQICTWRIVTYNIELAAWWPSWLNLWSVISQTSGQSITGQFTWYDWFYINDQLWSNSWYSTTIQITDLSWTQDYISNTNIELSSSQLDTIDWDINPNVILNSALSWFQTMDWIYTYISRTIWENNYLAGMYWSKPTIRVTIPAFQKPDNYKWQIIITLY